MMEWRLVMDYLRGGYSAGFNPSETYDFKRVGEDEVRSYKLADVSPYFNVAGLMWRVPQ